MFIGLHDWSPQKISFVTSIQLVAMENEVKIFATVLLLFAYRTSAKQVTFAKGEKPDLLLKY